MSPEYTDEEFHRLLALLKRFGEIDLDQFDQFKVGELYVYVGLEPPEGWRYRHLYRDLTSFIEED